MNLTFGIISTDISVVRFTDDAQTHTIRGQVTFGQVKSQEAGETHHDHAGVEVRRGVAEEAVRI